jgi:hypothetical protein
MWTITSSASIVSKGTARDRERSVAEVFVPGSKPLNLIADAYGRTPVASLPPNRQQQFREVLAASDIEDPD